MLPKVEHRYVAEILRAGADTVTTPLPIDWIPAAEFGQFQRMRDNAAPAVCGQAHIRPGWDRVAGAPYVSHVDVCFEEQGARWQTIPLQYFAGAVQHAVSSLVEAGTIDAGDSYRWKICAYLLPPAPYANKVDDCFQVEESSITVVVPEARSLSEWLAGAQYHGPHVVQSERAEVPVLCAPHVLREAAVIATAAGTLVAGGILLGKLARDVASGDLSMDVTAQIAAREALADDASLRFTPDTWKAVHAAISLRRAGESIIGWWHSHPQGVWPCRNCPPERRSVCASNLGFFSNQDVAFHRTAFQGAHNIALLLSFLDDPAPRFRLFGWRHGIVSPRGYYIAEQLREAVT